MDAYIDFPNFCSYLCSMSNQDFRECNDALLKNFNLNFTFDKSKLANAKKEIKNRFNQWSTTATKSRNGRENTWNVTFPPRPVSPNAEESFTSEQLSSVYMIDGDGVETWAKKHCLLVAQPGGELELMKNLRIDNDFEGTKQYSIRSMRDWSTIENNTSPCTDIIIVDQYIFAQADYMYGINSYALLEALCRSAKETSINIVIFTLDRCKNGKEKDGRDHYEDIPFKPIMRGIKEKIKNIVGEEPNVTFVKISSQDKHDRTIVTNYKMFTSGDSFKYFKEDGTNVSLCTHGDWLYISSLYKNINRDNVRTFINDLQEIVDQAKMRADRILGDEKSLFLKFERETIPL